MHSSIPVVGGSIETCFHDNLRIDPDGRLTAIPKPREATFTDFEDYRRRLSAALQSALANAPDHPPAVTISSGYDGAAIAVLAAELGCRDAVTISEGKPVRGTPSLSDSGAAVATRLGIGAHSFERLAYQRRADLPEAEFLASGFSGEEVVFSEMETFLAGRMLVSGFYGDGMWWLSRPPRPLLWRSDQSGSSLGEWRLRVGFVHVPLACFGGHDYRVTQRISQSAEMRPWVLHRRYDKPIPRRILETAGVRRVTFRKRRMPLWARVALKLTRKMGVERVAARVERRKLALAWLEPEFGSLLVRWAVSVVRPRYAAVAHLDAGPGVTTGPAE